MAELSDSKTYVKLRCNIWYDQSNNNVHVTSNDKDLPKNGIHIAVKRGIQSDTNLRTLLDKFGCGPTNLTNTELATVDHQDLLKKIQAGELDGALHELEAAIALRMAKD